MNNIRTVFMGMLKRLKTALVIALLAGLASIALYYCGRPIADIYSVQDKIDVAVIDNDGSELSAMLKNYLSDKIGMNIIEDEQEKFNDKLINRDVSAIIEIPQNFEKNTIDGKDVKIKSTTLDDYENGAYISVYIEGFMRSVNVASSAAKGNAELFSKIMNSDTADIKLTEENAVISDMENEYVAAGFTFSEGFMIMLVTAIGMFITLAVMDDRQYGTYSRMAISSVTGIQYIVGTLGASVLISLISLIILPLYLLVTGAQISAGYPLIFVAVIIYSLFNSALSIMLAQLISSKQALATLSGCIASVGALLGGAWFPIDETAGMLKYLSYITPQYWYVDFMSGKAEQPVINICVLILYTLLIMLASAALFGRKSVVSKA